MMSWTAINKNSILWQIFEDKDAGTPEDKTRLFLIYYLCTPNISESQIDEYAKMLQVSNYSVLVH